VKFNPSYKSINIILAICLSSCATSNMNWMNDKASIINNKTIFEINIPGTYMSNSYTTITDNTKCIGETLPQSYSDNAVLYQQISNIQSQEQDQLLKVFYASLMAQNENVATQLKNGYRYLSMQVCYQNNIYYTSNFLLNTTLDDITEQIVEFIATHPSEIIIIDFDNNLRNESGYFDQNLAQQFHKYLIKTFGGWLVQQTNVNDSIQKLVNLNQRIFIFSANPYLIKYPEIINKNEYTISQNPETATIRKLNLIQNYENLNIESDKLNLVPLYSEPNLNSLINNTYTNAEDHYIIENALELYADKQPSVIITSKEYYKNLANIMLKNYTSNSQTSNESN